MKIQLATEPLSEENTLILPFFEQSKQEFKISSVDQFLKDHPKFGKLFETQLVYHNKQRIYLVGAGSRDKFNFEKLQNWVGAATKTVLEKEEIIGIKLPFVESIDPEKTVQAACLGVELAAFNLASELKSQKELVRLKTVKLVVDQNKREYQQGLKIGSVEAEAINLARRLGDLPPNQMTPTYFLNEAKKLAKDNKLKITILDEKKAARLGLGAFTSVAKGSDEPSYMIALEYRGNLRSKDRWGLVGKGITFDTGGLNIKDDKWMGEMKYDMSGAGSVLAAIKIISELKLKVNVTAVMAVTENLINGKAFRPSDIVETYSGKTAEVLNTDAEGRMVLIDAVAWAQKDFKTNKIVDLATLTGAIIVALGDWYTGVFSNNDDLATRLVESGQKVGEKYWPLPMDEEFEEMIKSDFGDITNLGHGGSMPGAAGSITAAKFIEAGIAKDTQWVHLDIAGTAWDMKGRPFRGVGATGVGVKTLVELISASE